jgi:hypothetical protein
MLKKQSGQFTQAVDKTVQQNAKILWPPRDFFVFVFVIFEI